LLVLIVVLLVISPLLVFSAQASETVTTQLGLVVDGSSSISSSEFAIIREGIAAAVRNASQMSHDGTVELTVVQFGGWWSASVRARVEVYPTVITTANYESVANIIENINQMGGYTPLADGLLLCWSQISGSSNFPIATKQIINVATNGEPNIALKATPPPSWVTLLGPPPGDGDGDATWVRNGAVSEGLDELDAEGIDTTTSNINWMRDYLVYPQPGTIAPPYTAGWVKYCADFEEFAVAVGEKFRIVIHAPYACFTWTPENPQVCETVTFNASCSTPNGGTIISWDWDFGDNTTGTGEIVTHHYDNYGNYTVTLNVTDSEGLWDTESKNITVSANYTLSVTVVGGGSVSKSPDQGTYSYGTVVTLTASADAGWTFSVWSGDASGSNALTTVNMTSNKAVTATFTQITTYTLTITTTTGGTTSPAPGDHIYSAGANVPVTAIPQGSYQFDHWELDSVDVGSVNPYTVTMDNDHTLHAVFKSAPSPPAVGGSALPITLDLGTSNSLIPQIGLASALFAIVAATTILVRRRKKTLKREH